jgi:xylulokinase
MNELALQSPVGSRGLSIIPFGNGAERVLQNKETNCSINGINFNIHSQADLLRSAQDGIAFSFQYGMEIMKDMGMDISVIRAGNANMFLSSLFRQTLANISGATIELYDTDGAIGAARGAGIGSKVYKNSAEAFAALNKITVISPQCEHQQEYEQAYCLWKDVLKQTQERFV